MSAHAQANHMVNEAYAAAKRSPHDTELFYAADTASGAAYIAVCEDNRFLGGDIVDVAESAVCAASDQDSEWRYQLTQILEVIYEFSMSEVQ